MSAFTNAQLAEKLDEVAQLLEAQGANPFRTRAYRRASETLRALDQPVTEILEAEGVEGLMELPSIGESIGHALEHLIHSGRLSLLERLRGENAPERIFTTVAGIGPELADRIHTELGIETLGELEAAANDGRLAKVPGFGAGRVRAVRETLAGRFRRRRERVKPDQGGATDAPVPVAEILDVDAQYRHLANRGELPLIAPRKFNPTGAAWLPILHTRRAGRHYTALFSNTARAHEFGTTKDWVVIYRDDDDEHNRWTVITANYGQLRGERIVRGREGECVAYYEEKAAAALSRDGTNAQ